MKLRTIILAIALLLATIPAQAAVYEAEVDIIVQSGEPYPVIPAAALDSGEEEGLQYEDGGVRLGGFDGWLDGELVRLYAEIKAGNTTGLKAMVYLHTSQEKMLRWHNVGYKGKKLVAKDLKSEKAKEKKDELEGYEGD